MSDGMTSEDVAAVLPRLMAGTADERAIASDWTRAREAEVQLRIDLAAAVKAKEEWEEMARRNYAGAYRLQQERDSLRSQLAQAREVLEKMLREVDDWHHTEDCSRNIDCDEADLCDGLEEGCSERDPGHRFCADHGHDECPDCECGKGPMLEMIAKALAALSPPSPGSGVETKKCGVTVCKESLSVGRYDCTCGCGKSWCLHHGRKRKEEEMPGQQSYLVRVTREDLELETRKRCGRKHACLGCPDCRPAPASEGVGKLTREDVDAALKSGVAGAREMDATLREVFSVPSSLPFTAPGASGRYLIVCATCPHPARCVDEKVCTCNTACPHVASGVETARNLTPEEAEEFNAIESSLCAPGPGVERCRCGQAPCIIWPPPTGPLPPGPPDPVHSFRVDAYCPACKSTCAHGSGVEREEETKRVAAMVCPHTPGYACSRCAPTDGGGKR